MSTIHDKVQAILDRANHPNTPREEAETALAMAHRLILKHGLDEQAFAKAQDTGVEIVTDRIEFAGAWSLRRLQMASVIARHNSVAQYRTRTYVGNHQQVHVLVMYGTKADIFATKALVVSAELLASRSIPKGSRSFRHAWWLGFADGISQVLARSKRDFVKEYGEGAGLVLADKYKRADGEMRAQVKLRTTYARTYARSYDGYNGGVSAGKSFSTGGHRIGGSAVGALSR